MRAQEEGVVEYLGEKMVAEIKKALAEQKTVASEGVPPARQRGKLSAAQPLGARPAKVAGKASKG